MKAFPLGPPAYIFRGGFLLVFGRVGHFRVRFKALSRVTRFFVVEDDCMRG